MTANNPQELAARIARTERQNRSLRRCIAGLAVFGTAVAAALPALDAVSQGRTIEAQRFVLRRADGSTAGAFGTNEAGAVNLVVIDRQNRARATLGVNAEGNPALVLISPSGRQRVTLADSPSGSAILIFDGDGKARLAASVDTQGRPTIEYRDAQGKTVWKQE